MPDATFDVAGVSVSHGVVVRPGDTLLVALAAGVAREHLDELHKKLSGRLPDGVDCIVVAGVEQLAACRPETSEGG